MKIYINKIHYSKNLNFADSIAMCLLSAFTPFYEAGIRLRNFFYSKNLVKTKRLPIFVISVGNLTTGGTGKTPITVEIANHIKVKYNQNVAVLSHGYGGKLSTNEVNIISDGENIFSTPHMAGDEPFWIAENLNNIPVITGRTRYNSGITAINEFGAEVLILDDGFQHIKLHRDLNILVIDCQKRFGNNKILPAGPLREPFSEIKRADKIIVVNKKPFDDVICNECGRLVEEIKDKYGKPTYLCKFINGGIFNIKTTEELSSDKAIYAFAGIAQPEFFFNYLKEKDLNIRSLREFTDHHLYTKNDLRNIVKEAKSAGAEAIITTEKDAVKLSVIIDEMRPAIPFYALKLKLDLNLDEIIKL